MDFALQVVDHLEYLALTERVRRQLRKRLASAKVRNLPLGQVPPCRLERQGSPSFEPSPWPNDVDETPVQLGEFLSVNLEWPPSW